MSRNERPKVSLGDSNSSLTLPDTEESWSQWTYVRRFSRTDSRKGSTPSDFPCARKDLDATNGARYEPSLRPLAFPMVRKHLVKICPEVSRHRDDSIFRSIWETIKSKLVSPFSNASIVLEKVIYVIKCNMF